MSFRSPVHLSLTSLVLRPASPQLISNAKSVPSFRITASIAMGRTRPRAWPACGWILAKEHSRERKDGNADRRREAGCQSAHSADHAEADKSRRMPPEFSHKTLTAKQIDTLKRWVAEGAAGRSFGPSQRLSGRSRQPLSIRPGRAIPIDRFILAKLENRRRSRRPLRPIAAL